jgi:phosphoglycolate phosphatase
MKYDSLIFDLDGTLWDASPTSALAWSAVAKDLNIAVSIDEKAIKKISGLPFEECVRVLFGEHVKAVSNLSSLLDKAEQNEILSRGGRFYPGMTEGLRRLSQNYELFLVSNCQEWYLDAFFKHSQIKDLFRDSLCFGQTERPKGENIKEIVRRNQLTKPVYIGDTHWDQEASIFAGVEFIFARYGFGSVDAPSDSVDSIPQLVEKLK